MTTTAITAVVVGSLVGGLPGGARAAGQQLFDQPFHNRTADGDGAVSVPAALFGNPNTVCLTASGTSGQALNSCPTFQDVQGAGKLRLTEAAGSKTGALFAASSVPTAQGLDLTFDSYQYGGSSTPADGISFMLTAVNPAAPVAPTTIGPGGGSLGYSTFGGVGGIPYGYLAFGFDVFGNFSNSDNQGSTCAIPAYIGNKIKVAGQVVVHGPGNGTVGYCGINSTASSTSSPVVPLRAASRAGAKVPVEVVVNATTNSLTTTSGLVVPAGTYKLVFTPVGQAARVLSGALPVVPAGMYPASWLTADGYPKQLAFGWGAATGSNTDFHEIDNSHVTALTGGAAPTLTIGQTAYVDPTPVAGDPVTYTVVTSVQPGAPETYPITVTETMPSGVVPVAAYGTGWVCQPPSGQTISCINSNAPFPDETTLPTLTITGTVTSATVTPARVQSDSIATATSFDANAASGGEPGMFSNGDAPVRVDGPVYSNSTIVSSGTSGIPCADVWPLPAGTSGCNGLYVDEQVVAEGVCTGRIVTPATKSCSTNVHASAGDDPGIAAPLAYAPPSANVALQTLPVCSSTSSIVTFTPGYYDNAVGLSALTSGAAACQNKTFWFQPGAYYFDFHNSEMPTTGSPIMPYGSDVWTFKDATSVIVGGTKQGWTTSGVTAAALPGACVSPLKSTTATGVQFVFSDDSRLSHLAGSIELCGSYSATKPPIVLTASTGVGGGSTRSATLLPASYVSSTTPLSSPAYTTVSGLASATDGNVGPTITGLPKGQAAKLSVTGISGLNELIPARTVLDTATVTVRHGEKGVAAGSTLQATFRATSTSTPITRDLTLAYGGSALTYSSQTVDLLSDLKAEIYAVGGNFYSLDIVLTTSSSTQSVTQVLDFVKIDISWRTVAVRAQSGCTVSVGGCAVLLSSAATQAGNELYLQGTVYVPRAELDIYVRTADAPIIAVGVVARALALRNDAYSGGQVYNGFLIAVPPIGQGPVPLVVYLTAWTCASGSCPQPVAVSQGWKMVGRTMVQYVDLQSGVVSGQRDVAIKSWQLAR